MLPCYCTIDRVLPVQLYVPTWLAVSYLGVRVNVVAVLAANGTLHRVLALRVVAVTVSSLPAVPQLAVARAVAQLSGGTVRILATLGGALAVDDGLAGQGADDDTLVVLAHLANLALVVRQTTWK